MEKRAFKDVHRRDIFQGDSSRARQNKAKPVFNVCNIVRIAGFKVELTTNLADHLLLRDADRTLTIFLHVSYLMGQRQCVALVYYSDL